MPPVPLLPPYRPVPTNRPPFPRRRAPRWPRLSPAQWLPLPARMILRLPSVRIQSNRSSTCSEKTQSRLLLHLGPGPLLWRRRPMVRRLPSVRIQSDRSSTCSEKTQHPRRQQTCRIRRAYTRPQASLTFRRPVNRTMVRLRPQRLPRRLRPGPPLSPLRRHRQPTPARIRRSLSSIFSRTSPLHNKRRAAHASLAAKLRVRSAPNQIRLSVWCSKVGPSAFNAVQTRFRGAISRMW